MLFDPASSWDVDARGALPAGPSERLKLANIDAVLMA